MLCNRLNSCFFVNDQLDHALKIRLRNFNATLCISIIGVPEMEDAFPMLLEIDFDASAEALWLSSDKYSGWPVSNEEAIKRRDGLFIGEIVETGSSLCGDRDVTIVFLEKDLRGRGDASGERMESPRCFVTGTWTSRLFIVPLAGLVVKCARQLCSIVGCEVVDVAVSLVLEEMLFTLAGLTDALDSPALDKGRTREPDTLKSWFP